MEWDGVVDEYFTFFAGGIVSRKFKKGTASIDDWNSDESLIEASYKLSDKGIKFISQSNIPIAEQTENSLMRQKDELNMSEDILLSISFNQKDILESNKVLEEVSNKVYDVAGHKTLIKEGIGGRALQCDGYYSAVKFVQP